VWLFVVTGLCLVRLLVDPAMQRRPVLGQNLTTGGLGFLAIAAILLLISAAMQRDPSASTARAIAEGQRLLGGQRTPQADVNIAHGPAAPMVMAGASMILHEYTPRAIAVLAHVAVGLGLLFAGQSLFSQWQLGLAMATIYLLHPATAFDVGAATHVLPSAFIVWAFVAFRKPLVSGLLLGLACGTLFFPLFLLPLWLAFYGRRGGLRFATSLIVVTAVLATALLLLTDDPNSLIRKTIGTIRFQMLSFEGSATGQGFWSSPGSGWFRIPVIVAYAVMLATLTIWPRRKNLEHLLTASAAVIVGTQFWYPVEGGVYVLWYLPLVLMVVFRPRLVHLTAPAAPLTDTELAALPSGSGLSSPRIGGSVAHRAHLFR